MEWTSGTPVATQVLTVVPMDGRAQFQIFHFLSALV
eukprot:COSAG05_NODE_18385_length_309_cov_0.733333_1_plen_35_part_01